MSAATPTLKLWRRLSAKPFGDRLFTLGVGFKAPYFLSIGARVVSVEPGRSLVSARKGWRVHNHIGTFHAIAMCNLAELAMGMVAEATVPPSHSWIPKGIEAKYLARGETSLTAEAVLDPIPEFGDEKFDADIKATIRDAAGATITEAKIPIRIAPKPPKE
ncbi:MAG: hotdog fold domain-containing protein [Solirubrobacterales bacterium]